jgi:hypothetical protein
MDFSRFFRWVSDLVLRTGDVGLAARAYENDLLRICKAKHEGGLERMCNKVADKPD